MSDKSKVVKTFDQWCDENSPLNSEERPAAEAAWDAGQGALREHFPYQFTRAQLRGVLLIGFGPLFATYELANEHASNVMRALDNNPEVQALINAMESIADEG